LKLSLANNRFATRSNAKEAGAALGEMLKKNSVLTELDLSANAPLNLDVGTDGPAFAQEMSKGMADNGALMKLDFSRNILLAEGGKALAEGLQGNLVITELNIASNDLTITATPSGTRKTRKTRSDDFDSSGIDALADVIPGMRAMIKLDARNNSIDGRCKDALQSAVGSTYVFKFLFSLIVIL
jgi:hypothetical protein